LELKELQIQIEQKRYELNKLALSKITDLSSDDIVKISNELDTLIAAYIDLSEKGKGRKTIK